MFARQPGKPLVGADVVQHGSRPEHCPKAGGKPMLDLQHVIQLDGQMRHVPKMSHAAAVGILLHAIGIPHEDSLTDCSKNSYESRRKWCVYTWNVSPHSPSLESTIRTADVSHP